ncbi:MAG: hypothetical protein ONB13_03235 [candidate division KSB1 bacterium]|nr:hypothetical protein [candidate division KSB1 bacterium]
MKKMIQIFGAIFFYNICFAQDISFKQFNSRRNQINQYAMIVLGSWAVGNMAVNGALYRSAEKDQKYFYQMNVAWNAVNLAIAGFGMYGALNSKTNLTVFDSIRQQANIEKILLFNAGLDVGYIMTGLYLKERAKNSLKHYDRLKGYGNSLMLQGGFLLLFDITVHFIHAANHELMKKLLDHIRFASTSIGVSLNF